jgi:hypothetical protein
MEFELMKMKEESARRIEKMLEGLKLCNSLSRAKDTSYTKKMIDKVTRDNVNNESVMELKKVCNSVLMLVLHAKQGFKLDKAEMDRIIVHLKMAFLKIATQELGVSRNTTNLGIMEIFDLHVKNNLPFTEFKIEGYNWDFARFCEILTYKLKHNISNFKTGGDFGFKKGGEMPMNFYAVGVIQDFQLHRRKLTDIMIVVKETINLMRSYLL